MRTSTVLVCVARSVLALGRVDVEEAAGQAEQAVELTGRRGAYWHQGLCLLTLADAREARGDGKGAVAALRDALDRFERKELVPMVERTRTRLADLRAD
jgi:hypothetical protein